MLKITKYKQMFSKQYLDNYKINIRLAAPIMLGQAGHMVAGIADSIMAGQIGSKQLAAVSLANSVFTLFFIIGIGFAIGLTPLVGTAFGEKNFKRCGEIYKNGVPANILLGLILTAITYGATFLFGHLGQDPEVVRLALPYYNTVLFSILPYMLFLNGKQFLEGLSITYPAMVISIVFNILHIGLNYVLMYGVLGLPRMGLAGAALGSTIIRISMAVSIMLYIYYKRDLAEFIRDLNWLKYSREIFTKIYKIGIPIAVQHLMEVWAFAFGAIMAGWFGAAALAAHQIAMTLASLTFMAATGLSSTATIRLSNLLGEKKFDELKIAYRSNYILVIAFMGIGALAFFIFGRQLASFYVSDEQVISIAINLLIITGLFEIFDGSQVVGLGALRGLHDVKFPTIVAFTSYWIVMLPMSYLLSVTFNYGVIGVWLGYLIGLILAANILYFRLELVRKRAVRRGQ